MPGFLSYFTTLLWHYPLKDYLTMGYGIEARYKRCRQYWEHHIKNTSEFISRHIGDEQTLSIIGCGRMYDFPKGELERFGQVHLIDADPGAVKFLRKQYTSPNHSIHLREITNSIQQWDEMLRAFVSNAPTREEIQSFLCALAPYEGYALPQTELVVSLNMFGQIPVYWRERIKKVLSRIGIVCDENDDFPGIIEDGVRASCATLQRHALSKMRDAATQKFILLTDSMYHYYHSDHAPWQSFDAVYIDIAQELSDLKLIEHESWLWHIAPQYIESDEFGAIHEVHAYCFGI